MFDAQWLFQKDIIFFQDDCHLENKIIFYCSEDKLVYLNEPWELYQMGDNSWQVLPLRRNQRQEVRQITAILASSPMSSL